MSAIVPIAQWVGGSTTLGLELFSAMDSQPSATGVLWHVGEHDVALAFDAAPVRSGGADCEVTAFPVETGAQISDHVIDGPETVDLEGHVTDSPAVMLRSVYEIVGRPQAAKDFLLERLAAHELCEIVSWEGYWSGMMLRSVHWFREDGDSLRFALSFVRVTTVDSETVAAPVAVTAPISSATPPKDLGTQPTKAAAPATAATATDNNSFLVNLLGL